MYIHIYVLHLCKYLMYHFPHLLSYVTKEVNIVLTIKLIN